MDKVGNNIEILVFLDDYWEGINYYLGAYLSLQRTQVNVLSLPR